MLIINKKSSERHLKSKNNVNGICEYKCSLNLFAGKVPDIHENGSVKKDAKGTIIYLSNITSERHIANKILDKYTNGVTFVDAEWSGDTDLFLDSKFIAKSQYDDKDIVEVYEPLCNEFRFSNNFRQKTKGRELLQNKKIKP